MFEQDDDQEFERGFDEAREHAYDVKDAIRYIQECNEKFCTYGDRIFRLKDELLRERYIIEGTTAFLVTLKGVLYACSPGIPSYAYFMHHGGL